MRIPVSIALIVFSLAISHEGRGQAPGTLPPASTPRTIEAEAPRGTVEALNAVRPLADGRVLVNDRAHRRVILLDRGLRLERVVPNASPATGAHYGRSDEALTLVRMRYTPPPPKV